MTATRTRPNAARSKSRKSGREALPAKPDKQLWETDNKEKAFAAGVRWFLAVSRTA